MFKNTVSGCRNVGPSSLRINLAHFYFCREALSSWIDYTESGWSRPDYIYPEIFWSPCWLHISGDPMVPVLIISRDSLVCELILVISGVLTVPVLFIFGDLPMLIISGPSPPWFSCWFCPLSHYITNGPLSVKACDTATLRAFMS
jgi:hypothetical protein